MPIIENVFIIFFLFFLSLLMVCILVGISIIVEDFFKGRGGW